MKLILNTILVLLGIVIVLSGCESNTGIDNAAEYTKIYMPQAREQPSEHSLLMADTAQSIIYGAAYGGPASPDNNMEVNFVVDSSLVDSFNTTNGTSYELMPEEGYELSETSTEIPAGETNTEPLDLEIITLGAITPNTSYLLPVSIEVSGSTAINEDLKTTYFLIQGESLELDRSSWEIHDVDSEQLPDFPATNVIDGNPATFWHTQFSPDSPPLPHHVSIDMGETNQLLGLRMIGREGFTRGDPEEIIIEVSSDGENWIEGETFTTAFDTENEDTFYLSSVHEARYFRVTVTDSYGEDDPPITHFAEVYAF